MPLGGLSVAIKGFVWWGSLVILTLTLGEMYSGCESILEATSLLWGSAREPSAAPIKYHWHRLRTSLLMLFFIHVNGHQCYKFNTSSAAIWRWVRIRCFHTRFFQKCEKNVKVSVQHCSLWSWNLFECFLQRTASRCCSPAVLWSGSQLHGVIWCGVAQWLALCPLHCGRLWHLMDYTWHQPKKQWHTGCCYRRQ